MKAQSELITKRLDGKIAVITGGNSGIGLATAQRFVEEGAYVFIIGRRQSELDATVKQIGIISVMIPPLTGPMDATNSFLAILSRDLRTSDGLAILLTF